MERAMGTKSPTLLLTAVNWTVRVPPGHYFRIARHTPGIGGMGESSAQGVCPTSAWSIRLWLA